MKRRKSPRRKAASREVGLPPGFFENLEAEARDALPEPVATAEEAKAPVEAVPAAAIAIPPPAPPPSPAAAPVRAVAGGGAPAPVPPSPPAPLAGSEPQLIVSVGGVLYALPIGGIEEILPMREVAPLPRSSAAVLGILFLRGHPVTVIDLGVLLGSGPVPGKRIVVFRIEGEHYGLMVDEVLKVAEPGALADAVPPPAALGAPAGVRGVARLAEEIVSLLDIEKLVPAAAGTGAGA